MEPARGRHYLNFARWTVDPATALGAGAWQLLRAIRRKVDPAGVFRANHEIPMT